MVDEEGTCGDLVLPSGNGVGFKFMPMAISAAFWAVA